MPVSSKTLMLPSSAQKLYEHYRNLNVQGLVLVCPYHINTGLRGKSRALVGKGRPEEIEAAAEKYLTKFQMLANGDKDKLLRYVNACGLGVDCSGFAAWILNCLTEEKLRKPLPQCLSFPGVKRRAISKLRPYENISANLLTGHKNSIKIENINDIRPGDMIRVINGHHVVVISEVSVSKDKVTNFKYIQSTVGYGACKGVEEGSVKVINSNGYLVEQDWADKSLLDDLKRHEKDSRIVRLRALSS